MAKHAVISDSEHRVTHWTAPLAWAVVGILAGVTWFLVASAGHGEVPDRVPVPTIELETPVPSTDSPTGIPSAPLDPPGAGLPDVTVETTVPVEETVEQPVRSVEREPLEFETPPVYPEVDYRAGRIMEPLVDDGHERERALARCRGGYDAAPTAELAAYCDREYGPESGYVPGGW